MFRSAVGFLMLSFAVVFSAQADEGYPTDLKIDSASQHQVIADPGLSLEKMQQTCPVDMLNSSQATEARNISERVLRTDDGDIIEVTADLVNVPVDNGTRNIPVVYRCEFRDGKLTLGIWDKGLVGMWTVFHNPVLSKAELGVPLP